MKRNYENIQDVFPQICDFFSQQKSNGMYSGSFECTLCGFAAKYEDNLNKHLTPMKHSPAVFAFLNFLLKMFLKWQLIRPSNIPNFV